MSKILRDLIQCADQPPPKFSYNTNVDGIDKEIELPFVTGVFANFSGNCPEGKTPIEARQFTAIYAENFDEVFASYSPRIKISIPNSINSDSSVSATICFSQLDDFLPSKIDSGSLSLELVLNDPGFLRLESTWRGLFYLVDAVKSYKQTKIKIFDISKAEIKSTLGKHGLTSRSPLVRQTYVDTFCRSGGEPFGCFIGDYYFNQQNIVDTQILSELGRLSALVFAPFICGASPGIIGLRSFSGFNSDHNTRVSWDRSDRSAWTAWEALRKSKNSRFLSLALPRFLVRPAYGMVAELSKYIKDLGLEDGITDPCYANSAFAFAINIHRAYEGFGWPAHIRGVESGGRIEPPMEREYNAYGFVETSISDRAEAEFAKAGYMPLLQMAQKSCAAFIGAQSIHEPTECDDFDRTCNEYLLGRLPYLLTGCLVVRYLKCVFRDSDFVTKDPEEVERILGLWLSAFVETDPEASESANFFSASVLSVKKRGDQPSFLHLTVAIRPLYALAGMTEMIKLETRLEINADSSDTDLNDVDLLVDEPIGLFNEDRE